MSRVGQSFDLPDQRSDDRSRYHLIWQVKGVSLLLIEISKLVLLALIMKTTPVLVQEWDTPLT